MSIEEEYNNPEEIFYLNPDMDNVETIVVWERFRRNLNNKQHYSLPLLDWQSTGSSSQYRRNCELFVSSIFIIIQLKLYIL